MCGRASTTRWSKSRTIKPETTHYTFTRAKQLNTLESLETTGSAYVKFANKSTYQVTTTRKPLSQSLLWRKKRKLFKWFRPSGLAPTAWSRVFTTWQFGVAGGPSKIPGWRCLELCPPLSRFFGRAQRLLGFDPVPYYIAHASQTRFYVFFFQRTIRLKGRHLEIGLNGIFKKVHFDAFCDDKRHHLCVSFVSKTFLREVRDRAWGSTSPRDGQDPHSGRLLFYLWIEWLVRCTIGKKTDVFGGVVGGWWGREGRRDMFF